MDQHEMTRNPDRVYQTDAIAVEWEARYCIHSARCIMTQPEVFDPRRRPWVVLENGTPDEVATAVFRCPTGALHYRRLDGGPEEPVPDETVLFPARNGPLFLRGDIRLQDEDGAVFRRDTRMALCRCGQSANKPFCDNSHLRAGFQAP